MNKIKNLKFQARYGIYSILIILFVSALISLSINIFETPDHYSYSIQVLEEATRFITYPNEQPLSDLIEIVDINQDGSQELVTITNIGSKTSVYIWKGDENQELFLSEQLGIVGLVVGQFDLDKELEIIVGLRYSGGEPGYYVNFDWLHILDPLSSNLTNWNTIPIGLVGFNVLEAITIVDHADNKIDDLVVAYTNFTTIEYPPNTNNFIITNETVLLKIFSNGDFQNAVTIDQNPLETITTLEAINVDEDNDFELVVGGERVKVYNLVSPNSWNQTEIAVLPSGAVVSDIRLLKLNAQESGLVISSFGRRTYYGQPILGVYQLQSNNWVTLSEQAIDFPISSMEVSDIDQDGKEEVITARIYSRSVTLIGDTNEIGIYTWLSSEQRLIPIDQITVSATPGDVWKIKTYDEKVFILQERQFSVASRVNSTFLVHFGYLSEVCVLFLIGVLISGLIYSQIHKLGFTENLKAFTLLLSYFLIVRTLEFLLNSFQVSQSQIFEVFSITMTIFLGLACGILLLKEFYLFLLKRKDKISHWLFYVTLCSFALLLPISVEYTTQMQISPFWNGFIGLQRVFSSTIEPVFGFTYAILTYSILMYTSFLGFTIFSKWGEFTNEKTIHYLKAFFLIQLFSFDAIIVYFSTWLFNYTEPQFSATIIFIFVQCLGLISLFLVEGVLQRMFLDKSDLPNLSILVPLAIILFLTVIAFLRLNPSQGTNLNFWTDISPLFLVGLIPVLLRLEEAIFIVFGIIGLSFLYIAIKINKNSTSFSPWSLGLGFLSLAVPSLFAKALGFILILWGFISALEPEFQSSLSEIYYEFAQNYIEVMVDLSAANTDTEKIALATRVFSEFAKHIEAKKQIRLDLPTQEIESYVEKALKLISSKKTGGTVL